MPRAATSKGKVEGFMVSHTAARTLAEQRWGTGGTSYDRCNRRGAFYFSCSAHGGYVVDANALTAEERAKIEQYRTPETVQILVQAGEVLAVVGPDRRTSKRVLINPAKGDAVWQDHPVFYFEEDCDWAILESYTDIIAAYAAQKKAEEPDKYAEALASTARWHLEPMFLKPAA